MAIKTYFRAFLDIVFPPRCFGCNKDIFAESEKQKIASANKECHCEPLLSLRAEGEAISLCQPRNDGTSFSPYICEDCLKNIRYVGENRCLRCGSELGPFVNASSDGCTRCQRLKVMFDGASYATKFEGVIRELIHRFKYNNVDFLAEPLVEILINNLNLNNLKNDVDMVVPVPLFWWRRFKRGFNQSELLAKRIGRHLLLPVSTNNLYRIKNTIPQTRLSRSQRQQNMHRAFAIKRTEDFKNRRVLLVDDVLTTGVTASECARAIKTAGGEKVYVLTIAGAGF
ncbi:MAG TPA: ComF family protein [Candidatus Brocadiales bacterium]|nr:ComF family protein [Candidatus Brocadiales bacterium]